MDNINNLKCKTKNDTIPNGKPRIYFTCHSGDFDNYFEKICNDIFKTCDCSIYYTENMNCKIDENDLDVIIGSNNLIVVPVTRKLLDSSNRTMNLDIPYAKKAGITILPFMMETGIDALYSHTEKFGDIQYLSPYSSDSTEISYEEKLAKYLKSILISDETVKRIQSAFDFYIFLSYRKKDRRYANELMRLIHDNPEYINAAIWYDEFLTPAESFTKNIEKMISNSKLFTLLVTPNLLEEQSGKPNFVMGKEYPAAKEKGLPVISVEMESTNKNELNKKFAGIPECINPKEEHRFKNQLTNALSKLDISVSENNAEHNYLIGLAYRDGIDVEVNRKRGLELITMAAEKNFEEAICELVSMYYYGFDVPRDVDRAAHWQEKLIICLKEKIKKGASEKNFDLADAIRFYCEIKTNRLSEEDSIEKIIKNLNESITICDSAEITDEYAASRFIESKLRTLRSLAIAYEYANDFDRALNTYNKALYEWYEIEKYDKGVVDSSVSLSNRWRIAQIYHDIGILQNRKGDYFKATESLNKSLLIYQQLANETVSYIPNMIKVHNCISENAVHFDIALAEKHSLIAVELSEKLYKENSSAYDIIYSETLMNRMFTIKEMPNISDSKLEILCLQALDILDKHRNDNSHEVIFNIMNLTYTLAGIYRRSGEFEKAKHFYSDSVSLANLLSKNSTIKDDISISHILFDFATLSIMPYEPNIEQAKLLLNKSIVLFKKISSLRPDYQKYVDEANDVLSKIENIDGDSYRAMDTGTKDADAKKLLIANEFMRLYSKGELEEKQKDYEKAFSSYKMALDKLDQLKDSGMSLGNLTYADIYDRLALCCEYMEKLEEARDFYCQAVFCAMNEVEENVTEKAYNAVIVYVKKMASFCSDYGMDEAAEEWFNILDSFLGASKDLLHQECTNEEASVTEAKNDFLTPEQKEYFEKELDRLDFTPSYTERDEAAYNEEHDYPHEILDTLSELFGTDSGLLADSLLSEDNDLDNTIVLNDETGKANKFEFLDLIKYAGEEFAVLLPIENEDSGEVIILKVENTGNSDEEGYVNVENEATLKAVFEIFKDKFKDEFNFID